MEKSKFGDCRKFVVLGPEDNTVFYDDHRALFKFIVQAPISEEDFHYLMKFPGENPLFSYLCFLSMFQNPEIDDFGAWAAYVHDSVAKMCRALGTDLNGAEYEAISWALIIRTFYEPEKYLQGMEYLDDEVIQSICKVPLESKELIWAVYTVANTMIEIVNAKSDCNIHTLLALMFVMEPAKEKYQTISQEIGNLRKRLELM